MFRRSVALLAAAAVIVPLLVASGQAAQRPIEFPVTVIAANGKVFIPHRPRRIVSISLSTQGGAP